jgi:hypothetical protein
LEATETKDPASIYNQTVFEVTDALPTDGTTFSEYIDLADVARTYPPRPPINDWNRPEAYKGEVIAIGRAVYETQPQEATDNLLRLMSDLTREVPPGNLWLLPTYERLPYPYGIYWPLACAFLAERTAKRRFDWYIWMDDDVLVKPSDIVALRAVAHPEKRPFIAATPYDRFPPHRPSVVEMIDGKPMKWFRAPPSGTYPCWTVGLCLAIFHRSLFDRVPEPWFGACPPVKGFAGIAPDWWWCYRMAKAGITPYVSCDTRVIHLGRKLHVNKEYSERYHDTPGMLNACPDLAPDKRSVSPLSGAIVTVPCKYPDGRDGDERAPAWQPEKP